MVRIVGLLTADYYSQHMAYQIYTGASNASTGSAGPASVSPTSVSPASTTGIVSGGPVDDIDLDVKIRPLDLQSERVEIESECDSQRKRHGYRRGEWERWRKGPRYR